MDTYEFKRVCEQCHEVIESWSGVQLEAVSLIVNALADDMDFEMDNGLLTLYDHNDCVSRTVLDFRCLSHEIQENIMETYRANPAAFDNKNAEAEQREFSQPAPTLQEVVGKMKRVLDSGGEPLQGVTFESPYMQDEKAYNEASPADLEKWLSLDYKRVSEHIRWLVVTNREITIRDYVDRSIENAAGVINTQTGLDDRTKKELVGRYSLTLWREAFESLEGCLFDTEER